MIIVKHRAAIQYKKGVQVLFEASYRTIPFNVVLALLLSPVLLYNKVPPVLVSGWLGGMCLISLIRWIYCKQALKQELVNDATSLSLKFFALLTAFMGAMWGSIYFIARPYLLETHQNIILFVFAGMSAGALSSLSVYPAAYFAYILSMLLPVIAFNYSLLGLDQVILATMTLAFVIILSIQARENEGLLKSTFHLSEEKKFLIDKLERLSITDALTGLYNRRYFNDKLPEEYNRAKRNNHPITLVSIDIDNFKLINDNLGHPYGDKFLIYTADILTKAMQRANDIVFRLGGDEFVAILSNSTIEDAKAVCEKIKNQFKQEHFPQLNNELLSNEYQEILHKVTLSIGVVDISNGSPAKVEDIIILADKALYQAKHGGKDKIIYSHAQGGTL